MTRKLIISESEKTKILSMYGLLNESVVPSLVVQEVVSPGYLQSKEGKKYIPIPNVLVTISKLVNEIEISEIDSQYTDEMGNFKFENLPKNIPLIMTIGGGNIYYDFKKTFEPLGDKSIEDFAPFILSLKKQEVAKPLGTTKDQGCRGYKSDDETFYGYGFEKNKPVSNTVNLFIESESVKTAKRHAIVQYLAVYKDTGVNVDEMLKETIPYEIVCTHTTSDLVSPLTTSVVEMNKDELDKIVQKIINKESPAVKLDFENLKFKDAITLSKTINQPIFLLMGSVDDDATKEVISYIEKNQELTNKINKNYVTLYYEVDENEIDKYMTAINSLENLRVYPAVVILKGIGNPNIEIRKSFEEIEKEQGLDNVLYLIDTLI